MPGTLVYWGPELLRGERATHKGDMWALGVTLYQIITGEAPFQTQDEETFREDVMTGNVDWSRLATSMRLRIVVENCLAVDPGARWDASFILTFVQEDFAVEI
jgi:serine/threonine protein kinase